MSEWTFEKASTYVNMDHPAIASLLYDLDLLPEQIESDEERAQMILIVAHFIAAEKEKPRDDSGLRDIERAYSVLEIEGVPRERAHSVSNGISVLATRWRKEVAILEEALEALTKAIEKHRRALEADNPGSSTLGHESYDDELYALGAPRKEGEG